MLEANIYPSARLPGHTYRIPMVANGPMVNFFACNAGFQTHSFNFAWPFHADIFPPNHESLHSQVEGSIPFSLSLSQLLVERLLIILVFCTVVKGSMATATPKRSLFVRGSFFYRYMGVASHLLKPLWILSPESSGKSK